MRLIQFLNEIFDSTSKDFTPQIINSSSIFIVNFMTLGIECMFSAKIFGDLWVLEFGDLDENGKINFKSRAKRNKTFNKEDQEFLFKMGSNVMWCFKEFLKLYPNIEGFKFINGDENLKKVYDSKAFIRVLEKISKCKLISHDLYPKIPGAIEFIYKKHV